MNKGKVVRFSSGIHELREPIELDSFDSIIGEGRDNTIIRFIGEFDGPLISTKRLRENFDNDNWFYDEGVPVKFSVENLTIDCEDWHPAEPSKEIDEKNNYSRSTVVFYGKGYTFQNICIKSSPGDAFVSMCSARGGKRDPYLDMPEALICNLMICSAESNGFVFGGPHDSRVDNLIIAHTKGKGAYFHSLGKLSGACDIGFIHAYANDDVSIDIATKVKAHLLQGDTGRGSGVVIRDSNKTIVNTIESFKVRGSDSDYSVRILASDTQIGIIRARADAGASGVQLGGFGNDISQINVSVGEVHDNFKHLPISTDKNVAICFSGNQNKIASARITINGNCIALKASSVQKTVNRNSVNVIIFAPDKSSYVAVDEEDSKFYKSEVKVKQF